MLFISIYCILSYIVLFVYIVHISDFDVYHCVLHCTIQPTGCTSYNKRLT